jgi:hypothetical protein
MIDTIYEATIDLSSKILFRVCGLAQVVEHLPSKDEALSSNSRATKIMHIICAISIMQIFKT